MDNLKKKQNEKMQKSVKSKFMEFAEMTGFAKKQEEQEITLEDVQSLFPDLKKEEEAESCSLEAKDTSVVEEIKEVIPEATVFSQSVRCEGTFNTDGDLKCLGEIKGDIYAKGIIELLGKQNGNVKGKKIIIQGADIKGNVTANDSIAIDNETIIEGDVVANSIELDGKVTGLVHAEGLVYLHKNAILNGDIQAGSISIDEGAQIFGQITMKNNHIIKTPDNYMNQNY
ncbi:MAG: polymer-forming cytoskeletal protein [Erysipelotrichaceae bacterium]